MFSFSPSFIIRVFFCFLFSFLLTCVIPSGLHVCLAVCVCMCKTEMSLLHSSQTVLSGWILIRRHATSDVGLLSFKVMFKGKRALDIHQSEHHREVRH